MMVHTLINITIPYKEKQIDACINQPCGSPKYGIILTHGAGGDMHLPQLTCVAERLADQGYLVVRFTCKGLNLAYRIKVYTTVLEHVVKQFHQTTRWIAGGRSMGARAAVGVVNAIQGMPVAESIVGAICISYPLHPKDDKSKLRDEPLYELSKPVYFVSGEDDDMCDKSEFLKILSKVRFYKIHWIHGADHSLSKKMAKASNGKPVPDIITEAINEWVTTCLDGDNYNEPICMSNKGTPPTDEAGPSCSSTESVTEKSVLENVNKTKRASRSSAKRTAHLSLSENKSNRKRKRASDTIATVGHVLKKTAKR